MGSMIYLTLGNLEVDWGKNNFFDDHSALFRDVDLQPIPYRYVADDDSPIIEMKEGYRAMPEPAIFELPLR